MKNTLDMFVRDIYDVEKAPLATVALDAVGDLA